MTYQQLHDLIRTTCVECLTKGWDMNAAKHLLRLQNVIVPLGQLDIYYRVIIEMDTQ